MLAVDLRYFNLTNNRIANGVDIFAKEILDAFKKIGVSNGIMIICYSYQKKAFQELLPGYQLFCIDTIFSRVLRRLTHQKYGLENKLLKYGLYNTNFRNLGIKCIWLPYATPDNEIPLKAFQVIPKVYTLHDLIMHKDIVSRGKKSGYLEMLNHSNVVTVISNFVKDDVLTSFSDIKPEITVIPNIVTINDSTQIPVKSLVGKKYILDINAFQERKNAETLIKAYALIEKQVNLELVFCGGWKDDTYFLHLKELIRDLKLENKIHLFCAISIEERNWLLNNATLFITPSLSEGFGRTPIEAAICGIPVISSTSDSLKEVTLNLVHYYNNATDEIELAKVIRDTLDNPMKETHLEFISQKLRQVYSSEQISQKYWDIFLQILNNEKE